jgi:hypothetical protein
MKNLVGALLCGSLLAMLLGAPAAPSVHAMAAGKKGKGPCPPQAKAYKCKQGSVITGPGTITFHLASTHVTLTGKATKAELGTQVYLAQVSVAHTPAHGVAFKVFASGRLPALHLAEKGSLFRLVVATGKWKSINALTGTGIYAASPR